LVATAAAGGWGRFKKARLDPAVGRCRALRETTRRAATEAAGGRGGRESVHAARGVMEDVTALSARRALWGYVASRKGSRQQAFVSERKCLLVAANSKAYLLVNP